MKLKQAVLAAAAEGPATRYQLQVRAQELFPASGVSSGGIYHAVAECEELGHLHRINDEGDDDDVAVYVLTPAGELFLLTWATKGDSTFLGVRDELRDQVAFSEIEDLPWLEVEIQRHIAIVEKRRARVAPASVIRRSRALELPWTRRRRAVRHRVELGVIDGVLSGLRMMLSEVRAELKLHRQPAS